MQQVGRKTKWSWRFALAAICCWCCLAPAVAAQKPAEQKSTAKKTAEPQAAETGSDDEPPEDGQTPAAASPSPVVARVGEEAVRLDEHQREVRSALEAQALPGMSLAEIEAEVLQRLVDQRLVEQYCRGQGITASDDEVERELKNFKELLAKQGIVLADFLRLRGWDDAGVKLKLAGSLLSTKYVQSKLTPELIQRHFAEHAQDFDGTQIRVSHILLRPLAQQDARATEQLRARAARLRELIEAQRISFADAARRYSSGPSRLQGGDLGFVPRHGLLVDAFTDAAFALQDGEVSQPVVTPLGVHLIQRVETQPGKLPLARAQQQVAESLGKQLLLAAADEQRTKTTVEFTGAATYRDPKTGELVLREGEDKP